MLLKTLVTYLLCVDVVFLFYLLFSARVWFYNCHHRPAGWRTGTGLDEDLHQPNSPYEQGNFRFGCLVLLRLGWDCVGFKKILYIKREPLLSAKSQRIISGFRKVSLERRKELHLLQKKRIETKEQLREESPKRNSGLKRITLMTSTLSMRTLNRSKGLKKLGVTENDVKIAERLLSQIPPSYSSDCNKAEKILGYASSRLTRQKALRLLGASENEVELENSKNLGSLGSEGRRRSWAGTGTATETNTHTCSALFPNKFRPRRHTIQIRVVCLE